MGNLRSKRKGAIMAAIYGKMSNARLVLASIIVIITCLLVAYVATGQAVGEKRQRVIQLPVDSGSLSEVRSVLQKFQDGYVKRDIKSLDKFMELFEEDERLEVIGTMAVDRGHREWCLGRKATKNLVEGDWKYWGDVALDVGGARIHILDNVAWLATWGTVTKIEDNKTSYQKALNRFEEVLKNQVNNEEKILEIVREGTNTLCEVGKGETYIWPLRFTAVLIKRNGIWRFHQMNFSFPTIRKPDVRL
jgi:hypothetical protein